jgi:shikimate kinase
VGTLWLIGMMGAGKTTVGALVADDMGTDLVDTDALVEERLGTSISGLFAADGEDRFRDEEAAVVAEISGRAAVVACGGGVVLRQGNVARMRAGGLVVWLDADPGVLEERVGDGRDRPLLGADPGADLRRIRADREGTYRWAAHHRVDTSGKGPGEVAKEVMALWIAS